MQGLIGRTSDNSNQARIFVLFARTEATYDEEFVGIALTREQERAMGEHVDSSDIRRILGVVATMMVSLV